MHLNANAKPLLKDVCTRILWKHLEEFWSDVCTRILWNHLEEFWSVLTLLNTLKSWIILHRHLQGDLCARKPWEFATDHATRKQCFKRNFTSGFPTWAERKTSDVLQRYDTVSFTDGSEMVGGVSAGVSSDTHGAAVLYGLPGNNSVFQAEVLAKLEACQWMGLGHFFIWIIA